MSLDNLESPRIEEEPRSFLPQINLTPATVFKEENISHIHCS